MKKLMFVAVAALSTTLFAEDAGVNSANIVGYTTMATPVAGQFYALAIQFEEVVGGTKTMPVKSILTSSNPKGGTKVGGTVDQIQVWTGTGWKKYYWHKTLLTWCAENTSIETEDTVKNGDSVFFLRSSKGESGDTVTLAGGVNKASTPVSTDLIAGNFHFVSYPWPVEFPVNGFYAALSKVYAGSQVGGTVDQIQRWTGTGWSKYYANKTLSGFVKDGEDAVTTDKLGVGEGVFFLRSSKDTAGGNTLTFTKPDNF